MHLTLTNLAPDPMMVNGVQIQAGLAGAPAGLKNLRVYMRAGSQNGNMGSNVGWTEVANTDINVTAGFPTQLLFDIPFNVTSYTIPGNSVSGIYVVVNNGVRYISTCSCEREQHRTYIRWYPSDHPEPINMGERTVRRNGFQREPTSLAAC